jgi:hypothetical protein
VSNPEREAVEYDMIAPAWFVKAASIHGGLVDYRTLPDGVSPDWLRSWNHTILQTGDHFHEILEERVPGVGAAMGFTQSHGMGCLVRRSGDYLSILVPLGVPARLRVLAKALLAYWNRDGYPHIILSPLDHVIASPEVPQLLTPLFAEFTDGKIFWKGLAELDAALDLDPAFEPDVSELVHCGLLLLASHEFTHTMHSHHAAVAAFDGTDQTLSRDALVRGLELDADDGAAAIAMHVMGRDAERARALGQETKLDRGWLRLSYAMTMLYGVLDTNQRTFAGYRAGSYNHPMVRCELFFNAVERALDAPEEVLEHWRGVSFQGWSRCVAALNHFSVDAMGGKFGPWPAEAKPVPLHSLLYGVPGGPTNAALYDLVVDAEALMARARKCLPFFTQGKGL